MKSPVKWRFLFYLVLMNEGLHFLLHAIFLSSYVSVNLKYSHLSNMIPSPLHAYHHHDDPNNEIIFFIQIQWM